MVSAISGPVLDAHHPATFHEGGLGLCGNEKLDPRIHRYGQQMLVEGEAVDGDAGSEATEPGLTVGGAEVGHGDLPQDEVPPGDLKAQLLELEPVDAVSAAPGPHLGS